MTERVIAFGAALVVAMLIGGFLILALTGLPTAEYVLFISGPIVSGAVGLVLTKRVKDVQETTDVVKEHVNGLMTRRFDHIDGTLTEQTAQATEIADRSAPTTLSPDETTLSPKPTTLSPGAG